MGRPRTPTSLKIIKGTDRPDRRNSAEPKPPGAIPDPPDHLNELALAEWRLMAPLLFDMGLLAEVDRPALAGYCGSWARWVEAEEKLKSEGMVISTTNGNLIQNPWVGISNRALVELRKFLVEFGLTPASRSKVIASKAEPEKDPWDEF